VQLVLLFKKPKKSKRKNKSDTQKILTQKILDPCLTRNVGCQDMNDLNLKNIKKINSEVLKERLLEQKLYRLLMLNSQQLCRMLVLVQIKNQKIKKKKDEIFFL